MINLQFLIHISYNLSTVTYIQLHNGCFKAGHCVMLQLLFSGALILL